MLNKLFTAMIAMIAISFTSAALSDNADWIGYEVECGDHWLGVNVEIVDVYTGRAVIDGDSGTYIEGDTSVLAVGDVDKEDVTFFFELLGSEIGTTLKVTIWKNSRSGEGTLVFSGNEQEFNMNCYVSKI